MPQAGCLELRGTCGHLSKVLASAIALTAGSRSLWWNASEPPPGFSVAKAACSFLTPVSALVISSLLPGCLLRLPVADQGAPGSLHCSLIKPELSRSRSQVPGTRTSASKFRMPFNSQQRHKKGQSGEKGQE